MFLLHFMALLRKVNCPGSAYHCIEVQCATQPKINDCTIMNNNVALYVFVY